MRTLYTLGIRLYTLGIRLAALFGHRKARLMVQGWACWREAVARLEADRPTVWFHAASLGEFEQARPVLEAYRQRHPGHQVLLTFFSPSGYEVRKGYAQADAVCYLPPDTPCHARQLVQAARPEAAFFVKYDFWYNYLGELRRRGVPTYLFSAIFRPGQYFFRPWGHWYRRQLRQCFAHLFVQNEESRQLLERHGVGQVTLAGDTRFDRVHQIAQEAQGDAVVDAWLAAGPGAQVIVAGSSWEPDEVLLERYLRDSGDALRVILAPHVISEEHLGRIGQLFAGQSVRYSRLAAGQAPQSADRVLVVDNIGLLSRLYRYATVAYIGGGFGAGIHNILEAVTFGKPVVFGPRYGKFQEACDLVGLGGAWSHHDYPSLASHLTPLLADDGAYGRASRVCLQYMRANLGSTDKILGTIEK